MKCSLGREAYGYNRLYPVGSAIFVCPRFSVESRRIMQPHNLTITLLLPLLLILSLGCADKPTAPDTLTAEEIALLVETAVAEELAKLEEAKEDVLSPQEIAEIALKSTVYLRVKTQEKTYYGSGFVVGEGLIATCEHVIEGMVSGTAESVFDEKKYPVTVLAVSEKHDLAIVRVEGFTAPPLPLGDSDTAQVGETVFVAGNPKKLKGTFVQGIISAIRNESKGRVIQITAPASPGSSGGAVLNTNAAVIGVLSETETGGEGLHFAVSVNHLKALLKTIQ